MRYSTYAVLIILTAVSVSAEDLGDRGQAYYDFAVFAFEEENYAEAEKNLDIALHFAPGHPDYLYYLGKVLMETERYEDASAAFDKASAADAAVPGLAFDRALLLYRTGRFASAARGFQAVSEKDPENIRSLYYACLSHARAGNCAEAGFCLRKVGKISPSVRRQAGSVFEGCIADFRELQEDTETFLPPDSSETEEIRLLPISGGWKPLHLVFSLSRSYDDNVRLIPEDLEISADEGDWSTEIAFSGTYDFITRNRLKLGGGFDYLHTWYDELSDFEQNGTVLRLYASHEQRPLRYGFHYLLFYHWFNGDSALRRHRFGPDVTWDITKHFSARLAWAYYDNGDFLDDGRDGDTRKIFMNLFYRLPDRRGRLTAGLGYETTGASDDWNSFNRLKLSAGGMVRLPWDLEFRVMGRYADLKYDTADPNYAVKRDDDKYAFSLGLSRMIWKDRLTLTAEYAYTRNDSNILDREYTQNRFSLSFGANL